MTALPNHVGRFTKSIVKGLIGQDEFEWFRSRREVGRLAPITSAFSEHTEWRVWLLFPYKLEGEESEDADASDASDARAIAIAVEMRCATTHPTIFSREGFAPGAARRKR